VIGGGNMGAALVGGLLRAGWATPEQIAVVEVLPARRAELMALFPGVVVTDTVPACSAALVAVKPYDIAAATSQAVGAGATRILSIAAGVSIGAIEAAAGPGVAVVRSMPNTPALVGEGASAIAGGSAAGPADLDWAEQILGAVGSVLDAEFTKVVPALATLLPTIQVGKPLPNVPETYYTLSANYASPQAWLGGLTGTGYLGYSFRDDQIDATTGLVSGKLDDLTLRVGVAGDFWKIEGFVMNALDDNDASVVSSTSVLIMYPRRAGIMATVNF
jgi:hypothetical protein